METCFTFSTQKQTQCIGVSSIAVADREEGFLHHMATVVMRTKPLVPTMFRKTHVCLTWKDVICAWNHVPLPTQAFEIPCKKFGSVSQTGLAEYEVSRMSMRCLMNWVGIASAIVNKWKRETWKKENLKTSQNPKSLWDQGLFGKRVFINYINLCFYVHFYENDHSQTPPYTGLSNHREASGCLKLT